jgi:hypothetical protein
MEARQKLRRWDDPVAQLKLFDLLRHILGNVMRPVEQVLPAFDESPPTADGLIYVYRLFFWMS